MDQRESPRARRFLHPLGLPLLGLLLTSWGFLHFLPYNASLDHIVTVMIEKEGLDYLSYLLTRGLEQEGMRKEVISALEDQVFYVLVPNFGGYAKITVDYGKTSMSPEKDGFRYDEVAVTVSTIPQTNAFPVSAGILYPILRLERYSQGLGPKFLPELHVRIEYPLLPAPVSAIAYGRVTGYPFLWASAEGGKLRGYIQDFVSTIEEFEVGFPNGETGVIIEALGDVLLQDWRFELESALSTVLKDGINSILFDRDQDGNPDILLDLSSLIESLNDTLGSHFVLNTHGVFLTNITEPARAVLTFSGSLAQNGPGTCVGPDADQGFRYTEWEEDGAQGHDPPPLSVVSPSGKRMQVAVAVSDDFINQVLFNAYRTGLGCIFLSPEDPLIPPDVRRLMNIGNLAIFGVPWLTDLYPRDTSFGVELRIAQAPYVVFGTPENTTAPISLSFPDLTLSLYLLQDERWLRLMGSRGALELQIALKPPTDPTLLFDFTLQSAITSTITFAELYPEGRSDLEGILPQATPLLADLLKEPLAEMEKVLLSCLPGISVRDLEVSPLGGDRTLGLSHYLGLWVNLQGELNLNRFLNECLFGGSFSSP